MADRSFAQDVTAAARTVAQFDAKRRAARKRLAEREEQYREAQRALRLLVQSIDPYVAPRPITEAELDAQDAERD